MRVVAITALALAAAACGQADQATTAAPKEISVRSEEQNRLHQLDDMNRNIALKRAILASGLRCKRVLRSGYVTEHNKLSMWSASCDDKRDWAIFVGADGSAQVRPCADMARFKLPACVIAATPGGQKDSGTATG
jgi:hypothetical protein